MKLFKATVILILFTLVGYSSAYDSEDNFKRVSISDEIFAALERGDRAAVRRLIAEEDVHEIVRNISEAVFSYDLDRLKELLVACRNLSMSNLKERPVALNDAHRCALMLRGVELMRGDAAGWVDNMRWYQDEWMVAGNRFLDQGIGRGEGRFNIGDYDRANFAELAEWIPEFSFNVPDHSRMEKPGSYINSPGVTVPTVLIKINGIEFEALLDTGTELSIWLPESLADKLFLPIIFDGLEIFSGGYDHDAPREPTDSLRLVNDVEVLGVSAKGVMAVVSPRDIPMPIVGMPFLTRLSNSSIALDRVVVDQSFGDNVNCELGGEVIFSMNSFGVGSLRVPAFWGERYLNLYIDTAGKDRVDVLDVSLRPVDAQGPYMEMAHLAGIYQPFTYWLAPMDIRLGDSQIHVESARFVETRRTDRRVVLGAPMLQDYRIDFDFDAMKVCFRPRAGSRFKTKF